LIVSERVEQDQTNFTYENLTKDTNYYWQVKAENGY